MEEAADSERMNVPERWKLLNKAPATNGLRRRTSQGKGRKKLNQVIVCTKRSYDVIAGSPGGTACQMGEAVTLRAAVFAAQTDDAQMHSSQTTHRDRVLVVTAP